VFFVPVCFTLRQRLGQNPKTKTGYQFNRITDLLKCVVQSSGITSDTFSKTKFFLALLKIAARKTAALRMAQYSRRGGRKNSLPPHFIQRVVQK